MTDWYESVSTPRRSSSRSAYRKNADGAVKTGERTVNKVNIKQILGLESDFTFNQLVLYLMVLYYILCLIYMIVSLFRSTRRRNFLTFIFICALPFAGIPMMAFSKIRMKRKERDLDFYSQFHPKGEGIIVPDERDLKSASVKDVLLFNDVRTRREQVLDIFRGDAAQYVKELKMALNDPDTEVSHYASSALTEIKRKYDNAVILLRREVEDDPYNLPLKIQYAEVLTAYIECRIMDRSNELRYQTTYCGLIDEFWEGERDENDGVEMLLYKRWILYLMAIGQHEKAYAMSRELLDRFNNEEVYFAVLEFYYNFDYKKEFFDTIDRLRRSTIRLSKENLTTLRFFLSPRGAEATDAESPENEAAAVADTADEAPDANDGSTQVNADNGDRHETPDQRQDEASDTNAETPLPVRGFGGDDDLGGLGEDLSGDTETAQEYAITANTSDEYSADDDEVHDPFNVKGGLGEDLSGKISERKVEISEEVTELNTDVLLDPSAGESEDGDE